MTLPSCTAIFESYCFASNTHTHSTKFQGIRMSNLADTFVERNDSANIKQLDKDARNKWLWSCLDLRKQNLTLMAMFKKRPASVQSGPRDKKQKTKTPVFLIVLFSFSFVLSFVVVCLFVYSDPTRSENREKVGNFAICREIGKMSGKAKFLKSASVSGKSK